MRQADRLLEDEKLLNIAYLALLRRHPKSRTRGRLGFPAEIVLRLLLLKHIRNWSLGVVEREVGVNLLYRDFTRIYAGKVPDAKTLGRQARSLGPEVIEEIQQRVVELAVENNVVHGRKIRVDTTVVETIIHYPTDSSLLGDGNRVLTRLMKKVTALAGSAGAKMRDRSRSVKLRVLDIARAARSKVPQSQEKLKQAYRNWAIAAALRARRRNTAWKASSASC
jgi:IS5 family transposase